MVTINSPCTLESSSCASESSLKIPWESRRNPVRDSSGGVFLCALPTFYPPISTDFPYFDSSS